MFACQIRQGKAKSHQLLHDDAGGAVEDVLFVEKNLQKTLPIHTVRQRQRNRSIHWEKSSR